MFKYTKRYVGERKQELIQNFIVLMVQSTIVAMRAFADIGLDKIRNDTFKVHYVVGITAKVLKM